jgi:hypothetical protein
MISWPDDSAQNHFTNKSMTRDRRYASELDRRDKEAAGGDPRHPRHHEETVRRRDEVKEVGEYVGSIIYRPPVYPKEGSCRVFTSIETRNWRKFRTLINTSQELRLAKERMIVPSVVVRPMGRRRWMLRGKESVRTTRLRRISSGRGWYGVMHQGTRISSLNIYERFMIAANY